MKPFHFYHKIVANLTNCLHFLFLMSIDIVQSSCKSWYLSRRGRRLISVKGSVKFVQTSCRLSVPGISPRNEGKTPSNILRDKKAVPDADPPTIRDVNLLYQFFDNRSIYTYFVKFKIPLSSILLAIILSILQYVLQSLKVS